MNSPEYPARPLGLSEYRIPTVASDTVLAFHAKTENYTEERTSISATSVELNVVPAEFLCIYSVYIVGINSLVGLGPGYCRRYHFETNSLVPMDLIIGQVYD